MLNHTQTQGLNNQSKDRYNVSYFKNRLSSKKEKDTDILTYLKLVTDRKRKRSKENVKEDQPCISSSGTFPTNRQEPIKRNGLANVDFDDLPKGYKTWSGFKEALQTDPFTFIVLHSFSGKLCAFVKIPKENNFKDIFRSFEAYYLEKYGAKIDKLDEDTRLRFLSYDPKPFLNEYSEIYTDTLELETVPTELHKDNFLDAVSTDPSINFNNSGLRGLEVVNTLLTERGYTITDGKKPTIYEYQRPGGQPRSLVAFYNQSIVKFERFSPETKLLKEFYNLYELYKELKNLDDYTSQKELSELGFGEFKQSDVKIIRSKESYSQWLDFLEDKDIKLNELTGVIEIGTLIITDTHVSKYLVELSLLTGKNQSKEILQSCIDVIAAKNRYHPFLNFVEKLKLVPGADPLEVDELEKFIDCFKLSTDRRTVRIYLTRWLLGLFDLHINNRMTKSVLVLTGAQNSGKTSIVQNILPTELKTYGKTIEFSTGKIVDTKISLCSLLIANFDEFENILQRNSSLSAFKNLTSTYDIFERRPYRRNAEQMYRSSIIMATSNERNILTDSTGNTRFLTIDIQSFDVKKYLKLNMLKLWRVIYDLHLEGQTSVLSESERVLQAKENQNFESEDFISGLIEKTFIQDGDGFVTATEILLQIEKETKQNINIKKVGQALKRLGIEQKQKRVDGVPKRGYHLKYRFES